MYVFFFVPGPFMRSFILIFWFGLLVGRPFFPLPRIFLLSFSYSFAGQQMFAVLLVNLKCIKWGHQPAGKVSGVGWHFFHKSFLSSSEHSHIPKSYASHKLKISGQYTLLREYFIKILYSFRKITPF